MTEKELQKTPSESEEIKAETPESGLSGRFSLDDAGQILWQKDVSNPLPGHVVGYFSKGDSFYAPKVNSLADIEYVDSANLQADLEKWAHGYIDQLLGGIIRFANAEGIDESLKGIAKALHDNYGVVDRYKIEGFIKDLDAEKRKILRQHKVRLGPLLAFYYEHLKPEPLKLKSILWSVFHDLDTPHSRPKDGIVSQVIEDENPNADVYKMYGYPLYAGRAIRIDMLDRVVTDIYEQADAGLFRAQHKYAEWLGCSLDALYSVLEAMGHYKVDDGEASSTDTAKDKTDEADVDKAGVDEATGAANTTLAPDAEADRPSTLIAPEQSGVENAVAEKVDDNAKVADTQADDKAVAEPKIVAKPLLAQFKLKRGKLSQAPFKKAPKFDRKAGQNNTKPKHDGKSSKHKKGNKKPHHKKDYGPRVIKAGPKSDNVDDSPFAILKELNLKK